MRGQRTLSRSEIFQRLQGLGAAKATVEFSGGGDEGGVDSITLYDGEGNELPVKVEENYSGSRWNPATSQYEPVEPDTPVQELATALGAPVYERYGSFAGEFYVSGTVDYDVPTGSVKLNKSERVESYEDSDEDL